MPKLEFKTIPTINAEIVTASASLRRGTAAPSWSRRLWRWRLSEPLPDQLRRSTPASIDELLALVLVWKRDQYDDIARMNALSAAREIVVNSKIACFSIDNRSTYGWQRDRMWAQYADRHRGVCLCLDRLALEQNAKKLNTAERETVGRNVVCVDVLADELNLNACLNEGPRRYVPRYFREHRQPRHFTKLRDWEGESEYRGHVNRCVNDIRRWPSSPAS